MSIIQSISPQRHAGGGIPVRRILRCAASTFEGRTDTLGTYEDFCATIVIAPRSKPKKRGKRKKGSGF